jgi:hypothetical protein
MNHRIASLLAHEPEWLSSDDPGQLIKTIDLLKSLNAHVYKSFQYVRREEPGVQSPAETIALRTGSLAVAVAAGKEEALSFAARDDGAMESCAARVQQAATRKNSTTRACRLPRVREDSKMFMKNELPVTSNSVQRLANGAEGEYALEVRRAQITSVQSVLRI